MGDFASCQARVLGLSDEYQALGRWYFASGGSDFPAYFSAYFPHLYSDFRLDFSTGSSCFLSALASALPPPVSAPFFRFSSFFLSRSSALTSSAGHSSSASFPSSAFPFSVCPGAPVPSSAPCAPLIPLLSHPPGFSPSLPSPFPVRPPSFLLLGSSVGSLVSSGVGVSARLSVPAAAPVPSPLFRPFASDSSAPLSCSSTSPPSSLSSAAPSFSSSSWFSSALTSVDPSAAFGFGASEDFPEDSPPDAVLCVLDPGFTAVPESVCSEFRRMMGFILALCPQAAGSPVSSPPLALFEDFFSSSTPFSSPVFLNWFERVRSALSEADSRLACFVSSGRGDFLFLPSRSSTYAVHRDFALGSAAPVNPPLLSLFEHRFKPSSCQAFFS